MVCYRSGFLGKVARRQKLFHEFPTHVAQFTACWRLARWPTCEWDLGAIQLVQNMGFLLTAVRMYGVLYGNNGPG